MVWTSTPWKIQRGKDRSAKWYHTLLGKMGGPGERWGGLWSWKRKEHESSGPNDRWCSSKARLTRGGNVAKVKRGRNPELGLSRREGT